MSNIPKHEPSKRKAKPQPQAVKNDAVKVVVTGPEREPCSMPTPSMQHDINYLHGLDGIEGSLDWIARGLDKLTSDDCTVGLVHGQNRYCGPVQITLADNDETDTMDRLVTAFERIADSVAKLAGLSRPRLERWHEQDEYEPRYKNIAVDGGALGPKAEATDERKG